MSEEKRRRTAIEAARGTHFNIEPERLVLVTDKKHPLYDPRVHWVPDDAMVKSVMVHGVVETITARKNGEAVEVIDGRQRVLAALEANRRFEAEGVGRRVRVPTIIRNEKTDADDAVLMVATNEIRKDDDVVTKAEKAAALIALGKTAREVADAFGRVPATIKAWLRLMELAPVVKTAIRNGQIGVAEAVEALAHLPKTDQGAACAKLVETSALARREPKAKTATADRRATPMSRLRAILRADPSLFKPRELAIIGWIKGEVSSGELASTVPGAAAFTRKSK